MHLFCMSICISGCASICLDIHLFCRSACLLFNLVCSLVWQCIWQCVWQSGCLAANSSASACICLHLHLSAILPVCRHICTNVCPGGWISACLVARLSVWRSARSLVCSSGCIWQRVWSHINLPDNLSTRRPVLEAVYLVTYSGTYSARLSI